jgi:F0F1-type ATP synthase assembly protein I
VGPHFIIALWLGYYFGTKIDQWMGTEKLCSFIGAGLGLAAGFLNLFKEVALVNREEERAMKAKLEEHNHGDHP